MRPATTNPMAVAIIMVLDFIQMVIKGYARR